jgi:hypothetical protein
MFCDGARLNFATKGLSTERSVVGCLRGGFSPALKPQVG